MMTSPTVVETPNAGKTNPTHRHDPPPAWCFLIRHMVSIYVGVAGLVVALVATASHHT